MLRSGNTWLMKHCLQKGDRSVRQLLCFMLQAGRRSRRIQLPVTESKEERVMCQTPDMFLTRFARRKHADEFDEFFGTPPVPIEGGSGSAPRWLVNVCRLRGAVARPVPSSGRTGFPTSGWRLRVHLVARHSSSVGSLSFPPLCSLLCVFGLSVGVACFARHGVRGCSHEQKHG